MKVLLTGATGYIGAAVATALTARGHDVVAPARRDASMVALARRGVEPVLGDVLDAGWLGERLEHVDAAVHAASPGDATSAEFDEAIAGTVIDAFAGTDKPYLHTSGVWLWGSSRSIGETDPFASPEITAWRVDNERRLLDSGIAVTLPAPGIVYGNGRGLTRVVLDDRDHDGRVRLVGDGSQHWTTVHVDDLAELYALLLERDVPSGYVLGVSGDNPSVRALGESTGRSVVEEEADASRARLGALLADALLMDQSSEGTKARELGWAPSRPRLLAR